MLDGQDTIHRYNRIYYAYIRNTFSSSSASSSINNNSHNNQAISQNAANSSNGGNPSLTKTDSIPNQAILQQEELIFGRPSVLFKLGSYIMTVKTSLSRKEGGWLGYGGASSLLPLILLSERRDGSFLVMGISPLDIAQTGQTGLAVGNQSSGTGQLVLTEEEKKRLAPLINFKQFFKLAAKDMGIKIRANCK